MLCHMQVTRHEAMQTGRCICKNRLVYVVLPWLEMESSLQHMLWILMVSLALSAYPKRHPN